MSNLNAGNSETETEAVSQFEGCILWKLHLQNKLRPKEVMAAKSQVKTTDF